MQAIYPSLISADLLNLQATIDRLSDDSAGWHIDIMDNHFVPNLTWGAQFANAIAAYAQKPVWAHLMIEQPTAFLAHLTLPPASLVTFHIETSDDIVSIIDCIRKKKWLVSIAINPNTALERIFPWLPVADQILVMSVNPGRSGQQCIPESVDRVMLLNEKIKTASLIATIACDGGINRATIEPFIQAGATQFAVAQGIFGAADPQAELAYLAHMK